MGRVEVTLTSPSLLPMEEVAAIVAARDNDAGYITFGNARVKAWVKGVPFEPEAQKQVFELARMPFIFKHVAVMPDVHAGKGSTVGTVFATRDVVVPAAVGVDIGCFAGETRVPLLDGTQATLHDLAERTEPFWVYSVDADGRIAPGRAVSRKTRSQATLVKVVVSGGDEIVCTPDHPFMLLDGTYCEAENLRFNQSLMPLYRRWQTRDGYETCSNGRKAELTHKLVYRYFFGETPEGCLVHHKNHVHFDNRPENMETLTKSEHSAYHRHVGHQFQNGDPAFMARRLAGIKRYWTEITPEVMAQRRETATANIVNYMQEQPEDFRARVVGNGQRGALYLVAYNQSEKGRAKSRENGLANRGGRSNHKVILIKPLEEAADVYCLTVEKHHNFALAAGVFVHNCGVIAERLDVDASTLKPEMLVDLRREIERRVPVGGPGLDIGAWSRDGIPKRVEKMWENKFAKEYEALCREEKAIRHPAPERQLFSLGSGNHFCSIERDESNQIWLMLHSGSRGAGNRVGSVYTRIAQRVCKGKVLGNPDLAYLVRGDGLCEAYERAMHWAQTYAWENRLGMMMGMEDALRTCGIEFKSQEVVHLHHNYLEKEVHFGEELLVVRKGATRARAGEFSIIPGSMGAQSYIARGLGNPESFMSCSHGAGRAMSRGKAKRTISLAEHKEAMRGIEARTDVGVIDESPAAYKSITAVMAAQADLVEPIHELRPLLVIKG
jgi:tRNA-splicing ligase RtcB